MARFAEFMDFDSGKPVVINADYVIKVDPEGIDPGNVTTIWLAEHDQIKIQGNYRDVVERLSS